MTPATSQRVTSHDVARMAGVSQPTVSRALRAAPGISEATQRRVREAAAQLGYVPSPVGRALSLGRTGRVGLLVTDLDNGYYPLLIGPLHRALARRGSELVLLAGDGNQNDLVQRVQSSGLDGVLLTTTTVGSRLPATLRRRGIPCVCLHRGSAGADLVDVDPAPGLVEVLESLVSCGHTSIGVITGPSTTSTGIERGQLIRQALASHGIEVPERWWHEATFSLDAGRAAAEAMLGHGPRPTAIVCTSDLQAFGVLNAAATAGMTVPDDVAVTGFDDLPVAAWPLVGLTTVGYDIEALATVGIDLLMGRIDGTVATPHETRRIASTAILRHSSSPAPFRNTAEPHRQECHHD